MKHQRAFLILLIFITAGATSQTTSLVKEANDQPLWVQMMNDENANYYETVNAFNSYFKTHALPDQEVEEELMGRDEEAKVAYEQKMKRENKEILTAEQRKILVEREQLSYQVKRYRNWMKEVKPYVQENGHILTAEERMAIWKQQQDEIKIHSADKK